MVQGCPLAQDVSFISPVCDERVYSEQRQRPSDSLPEMSRLLLGVTVVAPFALETADGLFLWFAFVALTRLAFQEPFLKIHLGYFATLT